MSTTQQPDVMVSVTAGASVEVKKFMDADLTEPVSGRIGIWAKTDTVALIDALVVEPE